MTLNELIPRLLALQAEHGEEQVWTGDDKQPWDWGAAEGVYACPARSASPGYPEFPAYVAITWDVSLAELTDG